MLQRMLLFIHAGFALQYKSRHITRGSQTMEKFWYVNCDFWDRSILANCPYLIGTVPILTQEKVGKRSNFTTCPYFCKNLSVVMYRKFRNVPIFEDFSPIGPCFLGFRVGKYVEGQILKMTLPQENGHRIKTPSSNLKILMSSCWEKNFIRNNAHNFFILSLVFLKLLIVSVAFFLGHLVYTSKSTKTLSSINLSHYH